MSMHVADAVGMRYFTATSLPSSLLNAVRSATPNTALSESECIGVPGGAHSTTSNGMSPHSLDV
jgi:hypothetical protein